MYFPSRISLSRIVGCLFIAIALSLAEAADEPKWISLFDGKTLKGWKRVDGEAKVEVRDGAIVGIVTPGAANTYIATEDTTFGDFIFECEFKCDAGINSGVQFRSRFADEKFKHAYGYQYEIDPTPRALTGGIQEAGRRGYLAPVAKKGPPQELWAKMHAETLRMGAWNTARIEARGGRLRTWLNGELMADIQDEAAIAIRHGFFGMQIHQTTDASLYGKEVAFRNLRVLRLE